MSNKKGSIFSFFVFSNTIKDVQAASWTIFSVSRKRLRISVKYSLNKSNALSLRLSIVINFVNLKK